jgi:ABC-type dipeptide/oligopeptide/nickel transport system ATPase subunit
LRIKTSLSEPTKALERRKPEPTELRDWLRDVGLSGEVLSRYPHQLSGGQLQRIAVARALSVRPDVLYADEPTSALDVSVQAQVLNLLMGLKHRHGLTLVLVSHDLAVVARVCEQIIVLKDGQVVEAGETAEVMTDPKTAYTRTLVEASRATTLAGS